MRLAPVMKPASGLARKRTAAATSSGSPTRPTGYQRRSVSSRLGMRARRGAQMGVRIEQPMQMLRASRFFDDLALQAAAEQAEAALQRLDAVLAARARLLSS